MGNKHSFKTSEWTIYGEMQTVPCKAFLLCIGLNGRIFCPSCRHGEEVCEHDGAAGGGAGRGDSVPKSCRSQTATFYLLTAEATRLSLFKHRKSGRIAASTMHKPVCVPLL